MPADLRSCLIIVKINVHPLAELGNVYSWNSSPFYLFQEIDLTKRPLCYVFSGMGSQYVGMGRDLLKFPVFAAAIAKCDRVLRPKGIDIKEIITTSDPAVFDNILYCFVGIASIQVKCVHKLVCILST